MNKKLLNAALLFLLSLNQQMLAEPDSGLAGSRLVRWAVFALAATSNMFGAGAAPADGTCYVLREPTQANMVNHPALSTRDESWKKEPGAYCLSREFHLSIKPLTASFRCGDILDEVRADARLQARHAAGEWPQVNVTEGAFKCDVCGDETKFDNVVDATSHCLGYHPIRSSREL